MENNDGYWHKGKADKPKTATKPNNPFTTGLAKDFSDEYNRKVDENKAKISKIISKSKKEKT
jgi:hypothetical protein